MTDALIDLLNDHPDMIMFCSDDKHPDNLVEGHINQLVKRALAKGINEGRLWSGILVGDGPNKEILEILVISYLQAFLLSKKQFSATFVQKPFLLCKNAYQQNMFGNIVNLQFCFSILHI